MTEVFRWTRKEDWLQARTKVITSTDAPVLCGLRPYKSSPTLEDLWREKAEGKIREIKKTKAMENGSLLEEPTAREIAQIAGYKFEDRRTTFYMDALRRLGASTDFEIIHPWPAIFEIKLVNLWVWRAKWMDSGPGFYAPQHIEIQVQHQLLVRRMTRAIIGVRVWWMENGVFKSFVRKDVRFAHPGIQKDIVTKAAPFWASVDKARQIEYYRVAPAQHPLNIAERV